MIQTLHKNKNHFTQDSITSTTEIQVKNTTDASHEKWVLLEDTVLLSLSGHDYISSIYGNVIDGINQHFLKAFNFFLLSSWQNF